MSPTNHFFCLNFLKYLNNVEFICVSMVYIILYDLLFDLLTNIMCIGRLIWAWRRIHLLIEVYYSYSPKLKSMHATYNQWSYKMWIIKHQATMILHQCGSQRDIIFSVKHCCILYISKGCLIAPFSCVYVDTESSVVVILLLKLHV